MKHKKGSLLLLVIFVMVCASCGNRAPDEKAPQEPQTEVNRPFSDEPEQSKNLPAQQPSAAPENKNPASGQELLEISTISGTVVEFSEKECKITPTLYEENTAYEAAPE